MLLFLEKIDLDWTSHEGMTALAVAAERGNLECLQMLIDYGADINKSNHMSVAPLLSGLLLNKFYQIIHIFIYSTNVFGVWI